MASSSHLKQGEEGLISARVATLNKTGAITETIEVTSNDPKRPKVMLTVLFTVIEELMPSNQEDLCK
jgi:hypothetical protein